MSNLKFSPVSVRSMLILDTFLAISNRLNIIFQLTFSLGTWACMHIRLLYDSPTSYCKERTGWRGNLETTRDLLIYWGRGEIVRTSGTYSGYAPYKEELEVLPCTIRM